MNSSVLSRLKKPLSRTELLYIAKRVFSIWQCKEIYDSLSKASMTSGVLRTLLSKLNRSGRSVLIPSFSMYAEDILLFHRYGESRSCASTQACPSRLKGASYWAPCKLPCDTVVASAVELVGGRRLLMMHTLRMIPSCSCLLFFLLMSGFKVLGLVYHSLLMLKNR